MIMGTSNCHILLGDELASSRACAASSRTASCPAYFGYEAGQSAVGDIFAWFAEHAVPPEYHEAARGAASTSTTSSRRRRRRFGPGESGLLALDWWNGNRSVLVDADLQRAARRHDARDDARPRSTAR